MPIVTAKIFHRDTKHLCLAHKLFQLRAILCPDFDLNIYIHKMTTEMMLQQYMCSLVHTMNHIHKLKFSGLPGKGLWYKQYGETCGLKTTKGKRRSTMAAEQMDVTLTSSQNQTGITTKI